MFFSTIVQCAICFLIINFLTGCTGSQQVFSRNLVCKEAWPVVSDNEDPAPEPVSSWPEPPAASSWGWAKPTNRNPAPAGRYAVWVPAPPPEAPSSPYEWRTRAWAWPSSKWVRAPVSPTRCSLLLDNDPWPTDAGCFEETNEVDGSRRVYCRLHCEWTPFGGEIFFLSDGENTNCIKFINYNVERRTNDWYAWRSGACLKQMVTFRARCWAQEQVIVVPVPEPNGD